MFTSVSTFVFGKIQTQNYAAPITNIIQKQIFGVSVTMYTHRERKCSTVFQFAKIK